MIPTTEGHLLVKDGRRQCMGKNQVVQPLMNFPGFTTLMPEFSCKSTKDHVFKNVPLGMYPRVKIQHVEKACVKMFFTVLHTIAKD
jgi:hypothetical protein